MKRTPNHSMERATAVPVGAIRPRFVFVQWDDITRQNLEWKDADDARKETGIYSWSGGFVVSDTKKRMILAQNYSSEHTTNSREIIPRGVIRKVIEVQVPFTIPKEDD